MGDQCERDEEKPVKICPESPAVVHKCILVVLPASCWSTSYIWLELKERRGEVDKK